MPTAITRCPTFTRDESPIETVLNISAYQAVDIDPTDKDDPPAPEETNPNGLALMDNVYETNEGEYDLSRASIGAAAFTSFANSSVEVTVRPFTCVMMSPSRMLAS